MFTTPAAVRRGVTVCVAGPGVARPSARCQDLLSAVGSVDWSTMKLMDAVTAVSAVARLMSSCSPRRWRGVGVKAGLPADLTRLARGTVSGSGELLARSGDSAAQLRINVTSPGGTTAEALNVLMAGDAIQPLFDRAIDAATRRSRELAG